MRLGRPSGFPSSVPAWEPSVPGRPPVAHCIVPLVFADALGFVAELLSVTVMVWAYMDVISLQFAAWSQAKTKKATHTARQPPRRLGNHLFSCLMPDFDFNNRLKILETVTYP